MSVWLHDLPLVLASRSAARRTVLQAAGIPVGVEAPGIDERAIEAESAVGCAPCVAALLARAKARAVSARLPRHLVLGADQILSMDGRRFSKPGNRTDAREQLVALAGRRHELHSAVALVRDDAVLFEHTGEARLTMRRFSPAFLDRYLDLTGDAVSASVGAYQVEGLGIHLFEAIEGDHFSILGLPILALLAFLRGEGWLAA